MSNDDVAHWMSRGRYPRQPQQQLSHYKAVHQASHATLPNSAHLSHSNAARLRFTPHSPLRGCLSWIDCRRQHCVISLPPSPRTPSALGYSIPVPHFVNIYTLWIAGSDAENQWLSPGVPISSTNNNKLYFFLKKSVILREPLAYRSNRFNQATSCILL